MSWDGSAWGTTDLLGTDATTVTEFVNTGLTAGTRYYYRNPCDGWNGRRRLVNARHHAGFQYWRSIRDHAWGHAWTAGHHQCHGRLHKFGYDYVDRAGR